MAAAAIEYDVGLNRCAVARSESASLLVHCRQVLIANCCRAKRPDGCRVLIETEPGAASASTSARNPPSGPDLAEEGRDERERCPSRSVGRLRCVAMLSPGAGRDLYAWAHRRDIPDLLQREATSSSSRAPFLVGSSPTSGSSPAGRTSLSDGGGCTLRLLASRQRRHPLHRRPTPAGRGRLDK
jgi:hypothetical protein